MDRPPSSAFFPNKQKPTPQKLQVDEERMRLGASTEDEDKEYVRLARWHNLWFGLFILASVLFVLFASLFGWSYANWKSTAASTEGGTVAPTYTQPIISGCTNDPTTVPVDEPVDPVDDSSLVAVNKVRLRGEGICSSAGIKVKVARFDSDTQSATMFQMAPFSWYESHYAASSMPKLDGSALIVTDFMKNEAKYAYTGFTATSSDVQLDGSWTTAVQFKGPCSFISETTLAELPAPYDDGARLTFLTSCASKNSIVQTDPTITAAMSANAFSSTLESKHADGNDKCHSYNEWYDSKIGYWIACKIDPKVAPGYCVVHNGIENVGLEMMFDQFTTGKTIPQLGNILDTFCYDTSSNPPAVRTLGVNQYCNTHTCPQPNANSNGNDVYCLNEPMFNTGPPQCPVDTFLVFMTEYTLGNNVNGAFRFNTVHWGCYDPLLDPMRGACPVNGWSSSSRPTGGNEWHMHSVQQMNTKHNQLYEAYQFPDEQIPYMYACCTEAAQPTTCTPTSASTEICGFLQDGQQLPKQCHQIVPFENQSWCDDGVGYVCVRPLTWGA